MLYIAIEWWGYEHVNGTYHVKRYFDERDIDEAVESPFVSRVAGPFRASSREEAILELKRRLG